MDNTLVVLGRKNSKTLHFLVTNVDGDMADYVLTANEIQWLKETLQSWQDHQPAGVEVNLTFEHPGEDD